MRSAVILAGGGSTRMEGDKGLRELGGEPLVKHVIRRLSGLVDEVLVVVGSEEQRKAYFGVIGDMVVLTVDIHESGSPLVGALTGLSHAKGEYAIITGCDMPFLSKDAIRLLFREAEGFDGATFRWPNGWIEPLLAVYRIGPSIKKARELYDAGNLRLRRVLLELPDVKMIPIDALRTFDPDLITLYDADTEDALREAEKILKDNQTI